MISAFKIQSRDLRGFVQRTLTIGGSITVSLTSCLTGLDLTIQVNLLFIQHKESG